jgi:preprotein translocase subunit SecA
MFPVIGKFLAKTFGTRNDRLVKAYMQTALQAAEFEDQFKSQSDEQLKANTQRFREEVGSGKRTVREILPEAFAVVREAARRNMDMRHYDVQLVGGNVLSDGKIAEMATGEGKTLVATLAAYLINITGKRVHVVTVNDYLASRDAEWMSPVYNALGLSVGAIQNDMDPGGDERKSIYQMDIVYGTNNEFGFDYLRDNMKMSISQICQGELESAIIDEVDSILIDEARTPLIISGPAMDDVDRYRKADAVVRELINMQRGYSNIESQIKQAQHKAAEAEGIAADAKKVKDKERAAKYEAIAQENLAKQAQLQETLEGMTQYYEVELDRKAVHLTHEGVGEAQKIAGIGSFFTGNNMDWPHLLEQGLRAHVCFEREKDYVVMDGKVVIVDEFTGRLMHGRQWSDGLHQAVEAKERVQIKEESQTLATVTLQNFFKLYGQLAGMTGTAMTEAQEFMDIYKLDVVSIPTNRPCIRDDRDDLIYKDMRDKFNAIVEEINEISSQGRPILVGTVSIEKSEAISTALHRKYGVEHEVLNAKQHAREAAIVEKAGQQHTDSRGNRRGNVTIATNMAGRGTDIKLGEGVAELGGLHIIGTERHESRRIDNQLRGRAGRQGDKGSSQFFLCFDDDLLRIFAPDWVIKALAKKGMQEGEAIDHPWISRGIEKAQKKVEEKNFEARKSLLEYDEVMDYQRKTFYGRRRKVLEGRELRETIFEMIQNVVETLCEDILDETYPYRAAAAWILHTFGVDIDIKKIYGLEQAEVEKTVREEAAQNARGKISMTIAEFLEDWDDPNSWKLSELSKWVMSTFNANISVSKLRELSADEIEGIIGDAAQEQIMKKDFSGITTFLEEDFSVKTLQTHLRERFTLDLGLEHLKSLSKNQIKATVLEKLDEKYQQKETACSADMMCQMAYGDNRQNVYSLENLANRANRLYDIGLDSDRLRDMKPEQVHKLLVEAAENLRGQKLRDIIDREYSFRSREGFIEWAENRFEAKIDAEISDENIRTEVLKKAENFLRQDMSRLEQFILLQVYDGAWKEHLYSMDKLRDTIFLRSFAEKDPKLEYKQEGFRMFNEMLEIIDSSVTERIFKVQLAPGVHSRNVYNVSSASHQQAGGFDVSDRQRAAATGIQNQQGVKQIVRTEKKVGRNDPCPCGSGKKYKKCCGKN